MADNYLTMNLARWNSALGDYDAAETALGAIKDHPQSRVRDHVITLAAEATDWLFRVPAPTLGALRQKLDSYWGDLFEQKFGNLFRRIILGDLTRIELLLAGVDPEEASGGMNLKKVASEFAEAAREYDHYVKLHREGPTDNTAREITALMDEAESKMLALPAPNLAAVEKKLSAIWIDDRYDQIEASTAHITIMCDLRRLMTAHH
jgi:hypothetical protein